MISLESARFLVSCDVLIDILSHLVHNASVSKKIFTYNNFNQRILMFCVLKFNSTFRDALVGKTTNFTLTILGYIVIKNGLPTRFTTKRKFILFHMRLLSKHEIFFPSSILIYYTKLSWLLVNIKQYYVTKKHKKFITINQSDNVQYWLITLFNNHSFCHTHSGLRCMYDGGLSELKDID